ncbi:N-acetyl-gamma-glutamyl-phosphate reductase [Clostridium sp.]|uniref:N-acetyl-gamma-glutamyl-phosphate reductase n=1 Tax=Clostridium sp. TaxID=1506 RepID=UPI001A467C03|nr:N-acetyl-gamma-glutamyl-phosphate reductase [Clostridium sp.]MBK5241199.1 N-acetyl-gamma-glutamyl-phosphate reductase [Clostridium sp.]
MIKVGIVGATGYAGVELLRLLLQHPEVKVTEIVSHSFEDKNISEIYENFNENCDLICSSLTEFIKTGIKKCDLVFAALPHGLSEDIAFECDKQGIVFIDIGADFRLEDEEAYKKWYGLSYKHKILHNKAQYGLPELYREQIKQSKIIANPGCYPTSIILALVPALRKKLISLSSIIIDAKSGLTGAGRELSSASHYIECNESMKAYKIGCHRHTPEIEQELSKAAKAAILVNFTPHLLPINRGILSTIYCDLEVPITLEELIELYRDFYAEEKFVRVLDIGKSVEIKNVRGSNYCDISLNIDTRTNRLIINSTIDNMVKGAAGQAIQNMNLIFGFAEDLGLCYIPMVF